MKEELKPCRKCGEKKDFWIISNQGDAIPWIKCHNCKHEESALTWNTRPEPIKHEDILNYLKNKFPRQDGSLDQAKEYPEIFIDMFSYGDYSIKIDRKVGG